MPYMATVLLFNEQIINLNEADIEFFIDRLRDLEYFFRFSYFFMINA